MGRITTFGEEVYLRGINDAQTAMADGNFPASGSFIDVADFERFVFLVKAGSLDSALTLKVQQAATVNGTPKDIDGATIVVGATDDNKLICIEVETRRLDKAGYRYVSLNVAGAAGSNDYLTALFLGLNPGYKPVTQHTNTVTPIIVAG